MEKSVKKNFAYNIIYQILIMIIPLIISPYISRILKPEGTGIYSYTHSIVYYFMLITLLGVNNYGNRTIAKVRESKEKLTNNFWGIYSIQLIMGLIMLLLYYLYVFFICRNYISISLIQGLFIISAIFDINWFFFGLEEFKKTIIRNSIIKVLNVILIFVIIKNETDVWKYCLIMSGMTIISQLVMWGYLKRFIDFKMASFSDIIKHLKQDLILFIPVIAVSIYKIMDKIMLGLFSAVSEVGYYESAEKIVAVPLTLIAALGTVMLPRISNIMSKGNKELVEKYLRKAIEFVSFLSVAMCFGLIAIGKEFAPLYYGKAFVKTGTLISMLSVTIPFVAFANVIRTQYLIPKEEDNIYVKSVFIGAVINLILNLIFIPKYQSIGACFGTIAAEISVMLYQVFKVRKDIPIKEYIIDFFGFFLKAFIMFIVLILCDFIATSSIIKIIIKIIVGIIIYLSLNIKYITSIINLKKIFKIKNKL